VPGVARGLKKNRIKKNFEEKNLNFLSLSYSPGVP